MACALPRLPLFEVMNKHDPKSTAIVHSDSGDTFTYGQLLRDVSRETEFIKKHNGGKSLEGERVAFLIENSYNYVGKRHRRRHILERESD